MNRANAPSAVIRTGMSMCSTCITRFDAGKPAFFGCITDKPDTLLACAECQAVGGSQSCSFNRAELVYEAEADIGSRLSKLEGLLAALKLITANDSEWSPVSACMHDRMRLIVQMSRPKASLPLARSKSS